MSTQAKDLIVLGSGPGGYVAAIRAAQLGRKVTIVERDALGGICLNWGCIPSKALLRAAQLFHDMKHSGSYGLHAEGVSFDFPKVMGRSRDVAGKLSGGVTFLMKKNKIEVVHGTGRFSKGKRLEVTDSNGRSTTLTYNDIIIAVGARPRALPTGLAAPGLTVDGEVIHTYRTLLDFKRLPKKTLVIGGGAIGIEFGYFQASFGTEVTVVEMVDQILPVEDTDIAKGLEKILAKKGMKFHTGATVSDLKKSGNTASALIKSKNGEEKWNGDCVLVAIGFTPNTDGIGLEDIGIQLDRGYVKVNEFLQTNVPNHYAIGDIVPSPALAHVASHEGIVAAEHAAGKAKHGMKYDNIPACTYCQPQVASVGMTERALKEKGVKYRVGTIPFSAIGKAIAMGEPDGMIKVLIDDIGEVLGVHILHSEASELIAEATVIRSHEGVAGSVVDTIHPHPTISESVMEAMALALGRPINF
jgi:dihydrolipoamide dehydrogenase